MSNILIIEDNQTVREGLVQIISKMGHKPFDTKSSREGLNLFFNNKIDFIITDLKMDDLSGIDLLKEVKKKDPDALVMIITGYGTIETAVEAIKLGAFDFVTKPFSPDVIRVKVDKALEIKKLTAEHKHLTNIAEYFQEKETQEYSFNEIVGKSKALKDILEVVKKVSATDSSVLITGESGTGKELIARAVHFLSPRKDRPFIKVNCGSLAEGILESELFGHEKGAFTGAMKRRIGRFELADTGTIFLDEIGDFSPNIQLKLLRVLQEKEFERVGGTETLKVNVRVISATNKDLTEAIKKGFFREDLYYRLHIVPIHILPLRERKEDITELTSFFIRKLNLRNRKNIKGFNDEATKILLNYNWPGNIRELENVIEQSYVLSGSDIITENDLPTYLREPAKFNILKMSYDKMSLNDALEHVERNLIEDAYKRAKGVKAETARLLGLKTSALYYKLEKYGFINDEEKEEFLKGHFDA